MLSSHPEVCGSEQMRANECHRLVRRALLQRDDIGDTKLVGHHCDYYEEFPMYSKGFVRPRFHRTPRTLTRSFARGIDWITSEEVHLHRRRGLINRDSTGIKKLNTRAATITFSWNQTCTSDIQLEVNWCQCSFHNRTKNPNEVPLKRMTKPSFKT
jgi:hypothetical protein